MATVTLKDICKVYDGNVKAVKNANIDIKDKEFVVLVGPSGCGKSTTLRMVAGLEDISSGELRIDDRLVNDVPPKDRDIAMVFQNYALYPHMSVYDNMAFGLKIRKFAKDEIDRRVKEAAKILDIEELLQRKPKALSGGQRQRVAVGRAIVRKPKVFLFDEPLSNLDAKLRVTMRAEISSLHQRLEATMIYVTHDQVEAMTMADKIVVMKDGIIQQIGSPLELYNKPTNKFVAGFIGSPPMNFINMKVRREGGDTFVDADEFSLKLNPALTQKLGNRDAVVLGIRPESLAYTDEVQENQTIVGRVSVVEPLGAETHVYAQTGTQKLVARVEPSAAVKVGGRINLLVDFDRVTLFDCESELAL